MRLRTSEVTGISAVPPDLKSPRVLCWSTTWSLAAERSSVNSLARHNGRLGDWECRQPSPQLPSGSTDAAGPAMKEIGVAPEVPDSWGKTSAPIPVQTSCQRRGSL